MIALSCEIPTWAHPLPAGAKLAVLCAFTVALVATDSPFAVGAGLAVVAALYLSCGLTFAGIGLRRLKVVAVFGALILVWHALTGDPVLGAVVMARLMAAVGLANFVTMTTRLDAMIAFLDRLFAMAGLSAALRRRIALAIALVIRFGPVLADKGAGLLEAWRARSPRRPSLRIVLPFALLAIDDAEQVAEALRARGGA